MKKIEEEIIDDSKEYESLRGEIIEWQKRRFIILSSTMLFLTSFLTIIYIGRIPMTKPIAIAIPLILLTGASFISTLYGRFIAMIGTYLECFHLRYKWNLRSSFFKAKFKFLELNYSLGIIYSVLGISSSVIILSSDLHNDWECLDCIVFSFALFSFILGLLFLFLPYPRNKYRNEWKRIKHIEETKNEDTV